MNPSLSFVYISKALKIRILKLSFKSDRGNKKGE